jgi:hypothetical protein
MSGRGDSEIAETREDQSQTPEDERDPAGREDLLDDEGAQDAECAADVEDPLQEARRARWTAVATGALLTLAGLAAAALRAGGPAPALVPAAYAFGAAVCASAAVLGSRGRTRRALWLLVAGVMVMALGDHFD